MKVYEEILTFEELLDSCWGGAVSNMLLIRDIGLEAELMDILKLIFPEGAEKTELNDFIWFEIENYLELDEE